MNHEKELSPGTGLNINDEKQSLLADKEHIRIYHAGGERVAMYDVLVLLITYIFQVYTYTYFVLDHSDYWKD